MAVTTMAAEATMSPASTGTWRATRPAEDRLEPPGLLLTPGDLGDEADPEQREEEGGEEAELVLDDPAETVDALDPAVDRDEGVTGGDGLGVGVDLLGGGVEAGDRPRRCRPCWR